MMRLEVPEMSCGHCKASIERAVKDLDASARIAVDLGTRRVEIATAATLEEVVAALKEAGYAARPLA